MNALLDPDWPSANQQLLGAEFAHLRALLGDGDPENTRGKVEAMRQAVPGGAAIDTLVSLFRLNGFERSILLLLAGVEMDAGLAAVCGEARGETQQPWVTFGLALAALPEPHWSAIAPVEALRRWRLIELDDTTGVTAGRLRIDERVLHFIGGLNFLDHRLAPLIEPVPPAGLMADAHRAIAAAAAAQLRV